MSAHDKLRRGYDTSLPNSCEKRHNPNLGIAKCLHESSHQTRTLAQDRGLPHVSHSLLTFPVLVLNTGLVYLDSLYGQSTFLRSQERSGGWRIWEKEPVKTALGISL